MHDLGKCVGEIGAFALSVLLAIIVLDVFRIIDVRWFREDNTGPSTINKNPEQRSSGGITSDFVGQWSGEVMTQKVSVNWSGEIVTQKGSVNDKYPVVVTINSGKVNQRVGTVNYGTMGCSGELFLAVATSIQISVQERLMIGLTKCIGYSVITLTKNADGTLDYHVRVAGTSRSAILRKALP
jgi:hypothetical protein